MTSFYGCGGGSGSGGEGTPGIGIKTVKINEDGELIVTLTNNTEQNAGYAKGPEGPRGENGATFTPSIDDGILSWQNDKDLENPDPFDLNVTQDKTIWGEIGDGKDPSNPDEGIWEGIGDDRYPEDPDHKDEGDQDWTWGEF